MTPALINARWPLLLPEHRAIFHEERPWWEAERLADMHAHIKPGMSLIDVGSEEGDLTALYASWGAQVSFIDPSFAWISQTVRIFDENLLKPRKWFAGFAGDSDREGGVWETANFAHLNERDDLATVTLDSFCEYADALMIDTEGSELRVLQGAQGLLREHKPIIWVSVHPEFMEDRYGDTQEDLEAFLRSFGYEPTFLDDHHELDLRWTAS